MPKISHYHTINFFEIYAPDTYEKFVYKHAKTTEYVKQ